MAPESSKQKQNAKQSFDDELGDDFLSTWKPSKSMAALDFEDDKPAPKNCKASCKMGKLDTSFDFDFDGGLNALSKFNVDMSDLDLPSSHDKTVQMKDSSQDRQEGESKFSFQFNGFDELALDDTLKTNKEPETPVYSDKGKRDLSPSSTASKYCKKGLLHSFSDDASESTSAALAGMSINKESHKSWKGEPAAHQGKPSGGLTFSHDENCMHELGLPLQDMQEQASRKSENYTTQKMKDSATKTGYTLDKEVMKVAPPTPAHVNVSEECENETQELHAEKDSLGMMHKEEQTIRVDLDKVPQMKARHDIYGLRRALKTQARKNQRESKKQREREIKGSAAIESAGLELAATSSATPDSMHTRRVEKLQEQQQIELSNAKKALKGALVQGIAVTIGYDRSVKYLIQDFHNKDESLQLFALGLGVLSDNYEMEDAKTLRNKIVTELHN